MKRKRRIWWSRAFHRARIRQGYAGPPRCAVSMDYKEAYGLESHGDHGSFGVKILLAIGREFTEADDSALARAVDEIQSAVMAETMLPRVVRQTSGCETPAGVRMKLELDLDDYQWLMIALGMALASAGGDELLRTRIFRLINSLNKDNPNFTPYRGGESNTGGSAS